MKELELITEVGTQLAKITYITGGARSGKSTFAQQLAQDLGGERVLFVATAEAICTVGAKPVFVDVHPDTFNIDPNLIEAAITERTRAILPVHLFGLAADMDPIQEVAQKYNLAVIEDACQAHGARFKNKVAGSMAFQDAAKKAEPVLIAEAMYWCADSHTKRDEEWEDGNDMVEAYRVFKKLTWDYPETTWAKYARGRLSEEQMAGLDAEDNN